MVSQRDVSSSESAGLFAESSASSSFELVRAFRSSFCCADAPRHRAFQKFSGSLLPFSPVSEQNLTGIPPRFRGVFDPKSGLIMQRADQSRRPPNCRTVSRGTRPSVSSFADHAPHRTHNPIASLRKARSSFITGLLSANASST